MKQQMNNCDDGSKKGQIKRPLNDNTTQDPSTKKKLKRNANSKETLVQDVNKRRKYEKPLTKSDKVNKQNHLQINHGGVAEAKHEAVVTKNLLSTEKPDWLKFKQQKKELKEKRRAKRLVNVYDISVKAKRISEKLRRSDCTQEEREKLILKMHGLLEKQYSKLIFMHDMSRIIQWILRYCKPEIRQAILDELKPSLVLMFQSKYAKNCIKIMLKHGSDDQRRQIISVCYGNVVKLMSHSVSSLLLEHIYSTWATDTEKSWIKQEFYGDMYKQDKDDNVKSLGDIFDIAADMKSPTLSAVKGNLHRILNKKLHNSTLVQSILWEFLNNCSSEDKNEMIVTLRSSIMELSQTKVGVKVALMCIWYGTNKDRKAIMKALKGNVKAISMSEYGYMVLLALFDSVDDTVLLKKIILSEIQKDLTEIALNEYGRHVILYLVARRNSHYFPPSAVELLQHGDKNETSKKPADIREKELREMISDPLLEVVTTETAVWLSNSAIAMTTLAILKVGTGKKLIAAFESIAAFICNAKSKIIEAEVKYEPVEHAGLHMMLKKLIQNDKDIQKEGECTFGEILVKHLTEKVIERWITFNRGCFLLILLLENESTLIVDMLLSKLKPMSNLIKSKSSPGAAILLKKIK